MSKSQPEPDAYYVDVDEEDSIAEVQLTVRHQDGSRSVVGYFDGKSGRYELVKARKEDNNE